MEIHPESARMFRVDEEVEKAKNLALRLLGGRAYTCREILDKLRGRKLKPQAIEEAMAALERLELIDDWGFARRFVEERMRLRPMGPPMLARELRRRGVDGQIIDQVLEEAFDLVDLDAVALDLLRTRQRRYRGLDRETALSRMFGFLGRRGFHAPVAREAVERAWREFGEDGGEGGLWEE